MWSVKVVGMWSVTWSVTWLVTWSVGGRYVVCKEGDVVSKNLQVLGMWLVTFFISDNIYLKR